MLNSCTRILLKERKNNLCLGKCPDEPLGLENIDQGKKKKKNKRRSKLLWMKTVRLVFLESGGGMEKDKGK